MTQNEANKKMLSFFEEMIEKAENAEEKAEKFEYIDASHKLYITLTQLGAFDNSDSDMASSGFTS